MRDLYDILGVARDASLEEVKAAYRRACKSRHPDMGGSHEAIVELNTAYAFVLNELKKGYQKQREEAAGQDRAERAEERDQRSWEQAYRDIDEELAEMRRAAEAHEEALREMRANAWASGDRAAWAKLTWEDLSRFARSVARSGVKGLALLFAALVGVGSIFVEANFISALILLGSAFGFLFSLALKSDKGGMMSAGFLLFGIMTLWLPPVRSALFLYPVATISVLVLLALIFKFAQAGGTVGLMTASAITPGMLRTVWSGLPIPANPARRPPSPTTDSAAEPLSPAPRRGAAPRSLPPTFGAASARARRAMRAIRQRGAITPRASSSMARRRRPTITVQIRSARRAASSSALAARLPIATTPTAMRYSPQRRSPISITPACSSIRIAACTSRNIEPTIRSRDDGCREIQ